MAIEVVSSLPPGSVASLLEVCALVLGMLVAANMGVVACLAARWRLYARGTARLRDATWNIGLVDAVMRPRFALGDPRRVAAVAVALAVVVLEALAVLDLGTGSACVYDGPRTWEVRDAPLACFVRSAGILRSALYTAAARDKLADADPDTGIPPMTDVFEDSVVAPAAVRQVVAAGTGAGAPARAEVLSSFRISGTAQYNGVKLERVGFERVRAAECEVSEEPAMAPIGLEIVPPSSAAGRDTLHTKGFLYAQPCDEELDTYVCSHARTKFDGIDFVAVDVTCDAYVLSRDDRRPSTSAFTLIASDADDVSSRALRLALLASIVAENSASNEPCTRMVAVPKACTRIGSVSLIAVGLLGALFLATTGLRIVLWWLARPSVDWNSDYEHLIKSVFEHFDCTGLSGAPGEVKGDVHVTVLSSGRDRDAHHVAWTRDPVSIEPAVCVDRSRMIFYDDMDREAADEEARGLHG